MALIYIGITLQDTFYLWVPKEIACHLVLRFSQLLPKDQDHEWEQRAKLCQIKQYQRMLEGEMLIEKTKKKEIKNIYSNWRTMVFLCFYSYAVNYQFTFLWLFVLWQESFIVQHCPIFLYATKNEQTTMIFLNLTDLNQTLTQFPTLLTQW